MRTISCPDCGHEIAEDDFMARQCPVCDGFMVMSKLSRKVSPDFKAMPRSTSSVDGTLVEGGKEYGQDRKSG